MRVSWLFLLILLLLASTLVGAEPIHVRFLIPVELLAPTSGAGASLWMTDFTVRNDNDHDVYVGPCVLPQIPPCPPAVIVWPAGLTLQRAMVGFTNAGPSGRLFHVLATDVPGLHFNLSVRDLTSVTGGAGTELPIVSEDALSDRPIHLLNIPVSPDSRLSLRVYDPFLLPGARVEVRVFQLPEDVIVLTEQITFTETIHSNRVGLPFAPNTIERHSFLTSLDNTSVRLEIEPLTPGLRIWAFATVTNNHSQHITVFTPQP